MQYGTITHGFMGRKAPCWIIRCEPFVKTRLKRVFPRAPQQAADFVSITATPENTRELQWFIQRYPMSVDRPDLMEQLASQHVAMELRLADLVAGHMQPVRVDLAKPAREYQTFAATMLEIRRGLLLADDVGLGKTVTAICSMVRPGSLPCVVVCPAHLPRQWKAMIKEFAPTLNTHIIKSSKPYELVPDKRSVQGVLGIGGMPDVIIISYHKLRGWAETLRGLAKLVVYDEAQAMRHPETQIYAACMHLSEGALLRLGTSATPIHNFGSEFHHVINVLCPDALGSYEEYLREHCTSAPGGNHKLKDPQAFGTYLRREGIMLRRTRADVKRELPPLSKIVHDISADQAELDKLKGDAVALARIILGSGEQHRGQRMQASAQFDMLMRQSTGIAKAPYVLEFVKLLIENGEQVVVYAWHRAVYAILMEGLKDHAPVMYTGSESANQKDAAVAEFISGRSRVLLMSLRSGAGVDGLQHVCNTVVYAELDWSPAVHEQATGRVARDGQENPCAAYFLVADSGSDPVMAEVLGIKREQMDGVRDPENTVMAERIDTGELSIRQMAREFLKRKGESVTETAVALLPAGQQEQK